MRRLGTIPIAPSDHGDRHRMVVHFAESNGDHQSVVGKNDVAVAHSPNFPSSEPALET